MNNIIDGKKISDQIKTELVKISAELKAKGLEPGLATILVGENPASKSYIGSKIKACAEVGIKSFHNQLPENASEKELAHLIEKLNNDKKVHGILLQLPVPAHLDGDKFVEMINPKKDVDGLTSSSLGKLFAAKNWDEIENKKLLLPCTPSGIIQLMKRTNLEMAGKTAVVVGRSNLVGKPIAMLLLANNVTVTLAHSKTKDLEKVCREADILVAAIGKQRMVTGKFIKKGAIVIDVGINRTENGLCGDVDFESAKEIAGYITPVPGGVGKMTVAMLMQNTLLACQNQ